MYVKRSNEMRLINNHPEQDETLTDSPDGNQIVFTSLRDGNRGIYKMWYDGSAQTRLTNDPEIDANPVFSPNGSYIAFMSYRTGNGDIYRVHADGSNETRDYFEQLTHALRKACPDLKQPVRIVPVGDVLLELDRRMKAGQVPGFKGVDELYYDGIHFTNVGAFVVGTTFLATLYQQDPTGSDPAAYAVKKEGYDRDIPAELAKAIQATVWEVVKAHPLAGVAKE